MGRLVKLGGGAIVCLTQVINDLRDRLDRMKVALRNRHQGEVLNEGVENEEDEDSETLLARQNPRERRGVRGMLPERRVERQSTKMKEEMKEG